MTPFRNLQRIAWFFVLAALGSGTLLAQPFGEVQLTSDRTVDYRFGTNNSNDVLPNQDSRLWVSGHGSYSPVLDVRRVLLANPWVGRAVAGGPHEPSLRLAFDQCVENEVEDGVRPCTPVPAEDVDRLELGWRGDDSPDQLFDIQLNGSVVGFGPPVSRAELDSAWRSVSDEVEASLTNPALTLRFVSGPAVPYSPDVPWASGPAAPVGEGTGFLIDHLGLSPTRSGARGLATPIVIAPYEQGSGVLLGGPAADSEDSVYFATRGTSNRRTIAIWFPGVAPGVTAYAGCGAKPTRMASLSSSSGMAGGPIFLDLLTPCVPGWHVVVAKRGVADVVFHFTVAEHFDAANRDLAVARVGVEFPTMPGEDAIIRATLREAAWRLYGATGGTYPVRAFSYDPAGSCRDVAICWRNRPVLAGCRGAQAAPIHGSINFCALPATASQTLNAAVIAHEMMHAFTHMGDEYWQSHDSAGICGHSGVFIERCTHSVMGTGGISRVAGCTDRSHNSVPQAFIQAPGEVPAVLSVRPWRTGPMNVRGPETITECAVGEPNRAGPYGASVWAHLEGVGVAPSPHPDWSPSNFDYKVFADSAARQEIGRNMN